MSEQIAAHLLVSAEGYEGAASHQGGFFGLACASPTDATDRWVQSVLDDWPADLRHEEHRDTLADAAGVWAKQLNEGQLAFGLIVAGDDAALHERTETLAQWCQGYLVGLAMGGIKDHNALPGDVPEFVNDLLKISQAAADGETNEDENAFYELCEYVRVGVQLVFDELAMVREAPKEQVH
ncbi:MAG: UPF0149 family protein [Gammaproteobacteria bacterium]